jgi:hypothetical protein
MVRVKVSRENVQPEMGAKLEGSGILHTLTILSLVEMNISSRKIHTQI